MRTGGCYCGNVAYEFDDDSNNAAVVCYCKTCQKMNTGESLNLKTEQAKVKVTKGTPKSFADTKADSGKTITRYFCGDCSSALWSDPDSAPGVRFLKAGSLDNPESLELFAEIYVERALAGGPRPKKNQKQFEGMMAKEV